MPTPQPPCVARLAPRFRPALSVSAMCWCQLLLFGCSVTPPATRLADPPEIPAALAAECVAGPAYPAGDVPLAELLEVMEARERAAADCRARHRGLVGAWPR